jgi:hypothetical protein
VTQLSSTATAQVEETKVSRHLLNSRHSPERWQSAIFWCIGFVAEDWIVTRNAVVTRLP